MLKQKRTILQSLIKDLIKGFNRIYWFFFTFLKYYYNTVLFNILKKKNSNYSISLLLPTKLRSKKFTNMVKSLFDNTNNIRNIELLILFDESEEQLNQYNETIEQYNKVSNINCYKKNFNTNLQRINFLASKCKNDLILAINDDIEFVLKDWDKILSQEFSKINNLKPFSVWIRSDDVKYKYLHSNFPVINRAWYNKLLYHSPSKYFSQWWADNWICDLGKKTGCFLITHHIFIKHFNQFHLDDQKDQTYLDSEKKRNGDKDLLNWKKYNYIRIKDAKKLLN